MFRETLGYLIMAAQRKYYNEGTERKLQAVQSYLERFLTVLSKQNFQTVYVDAFAGSGTNETSFAPPPVTWYPEEIDVMEVKLGSALRALNLEKKFSKYVFIEKSKAKIEELKLHVEKTGNAGRVTYLQGDTNEELLKICSEISKPNVRAVVFLDPFGNQVGWDLLEALAKTRHVDLWYLFPSMLGVYRQIGNINAKMTPEQEASLDKIFGPNDWRSAFIEKQTTDGLFGPTETEVKIADVAQISRFMITCLDKIFQGGVCKSWLPLGRDGAHWYSLLFAMANPSNKAQSIGHDIAKHIMTHK
jgi:three-Cys-motif partner protein